MTAKISEFDVLKVDLKGINLVEAAAGTGKTYSIAIMILRWILSTDHPIDSVLAVTFTKYATAELKNRILDFLEKGLEFFEKPENCKDETIKKVCSSVTDKNAATAKLKAAINDFDTASIFTIHGFCHKIIREHAFELGIDFNLRLSEKADTDKDTATAFFREEIANSGEFGGNNADQLKNKEFTEKLSRKKLEDFISKAGIGVGNTNINIPGNAEISEKLTGIYRNFAEKAPSIAKRNRERKNIMDHNDILLILYEVLQGGGSAAQSIRKIMEERYSFVLIDEFQDTDPQQYFIFKELFFSGRHTLFFIGDPKQSIYAFRKADIFAYNDARKAVNNIYLMEKNFRSSFPAVNAVNEIFGKKEIFGKDSPVKYETVSAAKSPEDCFLAVSGKPVKGILVREVPNNEKNKPASQEVVKKLTVEHISQMIIGMTKPSSSFRIHEKNGDQTTERAVRLSDIAILVSTNSFALEVCDKLNKAGIPAVVETASKDGFYIFSSEEALAIQKLIAAVSTKGLGEFKTLLLTFFYNKTIEDLKGANSVLTDLHERFIQRFESWEKRGFYTAFSQFMEDKEILRNIAEKGEKTFAILRQLSELIHRHESMEGFSIQGTKKWLDDKIKSGSDGLEEENIRDDGSNEDQVRIMTLHKSKGLEFNIVFFPFILKSSSSREDRWMTRHVKNGDVYKREMKLVPKGKQDDEGTDEALEEIRRIYVGITRAKYLTVCYTQKEKKSLEPTSLFKNETSKCVDFKPLSIQDTSEGSAALEKADDRVEPAPPETAKRAITPEWAISSYSRITSSNADTDQENEEERPVRDTASKEVSVPMAVFPCGTDAGTVLHSIFEEADFSSSDNTGIIRAILKKKMNFKEDELKEMVKLVNECLNNVFSAPIFEGKTLREVKEKTAEMKFFLSIKNNIKKGQLSKIIEEKYGTVPIEDDSITKGFLNGIIDLAAKVDGKYYIIDWKSNNLKEPADPDDPYSAYNKEKMEKEMKKHNYHLQYMLYLAAFDRYMKSVDKNYSYEKNFGGIRYVFLRGVNSGKCETGIFSDRPEEAELRKIQELFEGEK